MNWDADNIAGLAEQYSWLLEVAFYAAAVFAALAAWRRYRRWRCPKPDPANLIHAVNGPVVFAVAGLGALQILETAAAQIPGIVFSAETVRTVFVIALSLWGLLRIIAASEKKYDRPLKINEGTIDRGTVRAGFRIARYALIIAAALTVMDSLGFSISGFLAFGGIGGAIVAFAAQKTLSNFFSGMIIFTERPFTVGDWIRCPGTDVEGVVENIGWRTTQLRTFDHRPLYVPNALFSDNVIENPQRMTNRRIYEKMGLRYADIGKMAAVLTDVRAMLHAHPGIDQGQILMANFDNYGDSSVNFFVYALTRTTKWEEFHEVKEDVLLKIAAIVEKREAEFAFPTRTVHVSPADFPPGK